MPSLHSSLLVLGLSVLLVPPAGAQIVPDRSLGDNSQVVPDLVNGLPSDRIEGGARRGASLFHSFRDFNVGAGRGAYFANPNGVANIFTRVTGGNPSNILGTLGVLGGANLFLINPSGIVFGANARLDLRGSFLASTADRLVFDNGYSFNATNPQAPPLLTINTPIGLQFRSNPGSIVNQSATTQSVFGVSFPLGLGVDQGQTLALLGGNVVLDGGNLSAAQGIIRLGSVRSGFVGFDSAGGLDYSSVSNFGNVTLSGSAGVITSGLGGGAIEVRGRNVSLGNRSSLVSDTFGDENGRAITIDANRFRLENRAYVSSATLSGGSAADITIRAGEAIDLRGSGFANFRQSYLSSISNGTVSIANRQSAISSATLGTGRAGNISLEAQRLTLRQGAAVISPSRGTGAGGDIFIRASEAIDAIGSGLVTVALDQGNGGTLTLETGRLSVRNGAVVASSTFGAGQGGDLTVGASDSIVVSRFRNDSPFVTSISTNTIGGTGQAGDINLTTGSLRVDGGAAITSSSGVTARDFLIPTGGAGGDLTITANDISIISTNVRNPRSRTLVATGTAGSADAGSLRINTQRLVVAGGSGLGASTLGSGRGGNVNIQASESIDVNGMTADGRAPSGIATASGDLLYESSFSVTPIGAAGDLNITTPMLTIRDGGALSVASAGSGRAGAIDVVANEIGLDNGSIDGNTGSGAGGNIRLQAQVTQLNRASRISTDAGRSNGGNIAIDSPFLIGFPNGNSDITANARTAQGGRVEVNATNVFGAAASTREQIQTRLGLTDAQFANLRVNPTTLLPTNDIAAISQSATAVLQGTVTFSTAGINPAQALVELPQTVIDPNTLIADRPCTQTEGSEFAITGRGGLPPSPSDSLSSQPNQYAWVEPAPSGAIGYSPAFQSAVSVPIQPTQGWVMDASGEVTLTGDRGSGDIQGGQPLRTAPRSAACLPR